MTAFLAFSVLGLVVGCIYALTATGLVVTYTTSGIFNFAHGAVGMIGAFTYWQFSVAWGVPQVIALPLVLLVLAPLFGAFVERVLIRPLQGASVDLTIVITLGLLVFLIGLANVVWKPTVTRVLPPIPASGQVQIGALAVTASQIVVVVVALSVAFGLKVLFTRARIGIAMRGVVDDPDLIAMAGASPARIQQLAWAIGASLAALAGILLAPQVNLDILTLTLLVINGYAAALIGRLKSLPLTAAGGLVLGLLVTYSTGYVPIDGVIARFLDVVPLQEVLPQLLLFAVLVFLPAARLRTGGALAPALPRIPGLRQSLAAAAVLVAGALLASTVLGTDGLTIGGRTFVVGLTLLSLVLLTGYSGQVSLCQLTFVGLGAYAMGTFGGGSLVGVFAAITLAAVFGLLVALPTLKLRGLYLALATFAFAAAMDTVFFQQRFGSGGSLDVARVHLPLVPTQSDQAFFVLTAVVFAACGVGVLAIRRGRYGRQLTALNDSPAACATLGLNITISKLVVFTAAAGLAGLSGALFGGLRGSVGPNDFAALGSLLLLLSLRIGGVNTITGALLGGYFVASSPGLQDRFPAIPQVAFLLTGITAIIIGRDPNGIGGRICDLGDKVRAQLGSGTPPPATTPTAAPRPVPAAAKEKSLAGAAS